jgi:hypothetical protein
MFTHRERERERDEQRITIMGSFNVTLKTVKIGVNDTLLIASVSYVKERFVGVTAEAVNIKKNVCLCALERERVTHRHG